MRTEVEKITPPPQKKTKKKRYLTCTSLLACMRAVAYLCHTNRSDFFALSKLNIFLIIVIPFSENFVGSVLICFHCKLLNCSKTHCVIIFEYFSFFFFKMLFFLVPPRKISGKFGDFSPPVSWQICFVISANLRLKFAIFNPFLPFFCKV